MICKDLSPVSFSASVPASVSDTGSSGRDPNPRAGTDAVNRLLTATPPMRR